jgi:hypothetical protein
MRSLTLSLVAFSLLVLPACDESVPLPPPVAPVASLPGAAMPMEPPQVAAQAQAWPTSTSNAAPPAPITMAPAPAAAPAPPGGSVSNAQAVVAAMAPGFRRCYVEGLNADPKLSGKVRVTGKIGPDGAVVSATPSATTLNEKVLACVVARVLAARFSPPEGGGATVVIPVTFAKGQSAPTIDVGPDVPAP